MKASEYTLIDEDTNTHLFPEQEFCGTWRLQSTDKDIIANMKERCRRGGKWWQVGWGANDKSVDIYACEFLRREKAELWFTQFIGDRVADKMAK